MPQLEPTGLLGARIGLLRDMFAASALFRTWCGAANAEAAKAFVIYNEVTGANNFFPKVILAHDGEHTFESIDSGAGYRDAITVYVQLEGTPSNTYATDDAGAETEFSNTIGPIIAEVRAQSGVAGRMQVLSGAMVMPPRVTHGPENTERRHVNAAYVFVLGTR